MDKLKDVIKDSSPETDASTDSGGLLVCEKCGEPRQKQMFLSGRDKPFIIHIPCECERRAERERLKRDELASAKKKVDEMRRECFARSGFYRDCTFAGDDGLTPGLSSVCQRYADAFDPNDPYGLLLWGSVGTGKSFMSSSIANRVIDLGYSALQTDVRCIVNLMESSFENRQRNLDRILGYDLLLIEDLGAQRSTSYMMEHVFSVIDGRYKTGKPMVVTTNFGSDRINGSLHDGDDPWSRIFDRILERCYPIRFTGENRRTIKKDDMRKIMRERLGI